MSLAIVLTVGIVGGEAAARIKMPRVTGWIITGVVLRALTADIIDAQQIAQFKPLSDFVLGYIAFTVGSHLHLRSLINAQRRLFLIVLTEMIITPAVVILVMTTLGGLSLHHSMLFAAIAVAGAPGTTVIVIQEARARGVFVKTLIGSVALIDIVAVCVFVVAIELIHAAEGFEAGTIAAAMAALARSVGLAAVVATVGALITLGLTRAVVGPRLLGTCLIASILLAWGTAASLGVSSILTVTLLGALLANIMPDKERAGEAYLNTFASVLFTAFYTLAGMRLDFSNIVPMAGLIALFFSARLVGKNISAFTAMTAARAPASVRNYLGLALLPHGGVAIGLIVIVQSDPALVELSDSILAVGLSALAVNQFLGPSATRWSLQRTGEFGRDRPRLFDFIREQDIVVDLKAPTQEEAIRKLVDHLFRTHDVQSDKKAFLDGLLARENMESWYLGEGLMMPHGRVEMGDEFAGVVGLSQKGFQWDAPDGRPIHAIVVLATPERQRDRHLEVLASFAQAISSERNIKEQLYHAHTAAHAYEILHADESEDFNYFLEDALERPDAKPAAPVAKPAPT
ncbi:MAG: PTS sugar transporter subunit IIA [Myxococcota bacterium]